MTYMNIWLVRLNGAPFIEITAPSYMSATLVAQQILLNGDPGHPDVIYRWMQVEQNVKGNGSGKS